LNDRGGAVGRRLQAHPASVAIARRAVGDALRLARRDDLVEAAQLLVSEIVTNALVHAGTPIDFQASVGVTGLRVEVTDGSTQMPVPRTYGAMAGTGRGLRLLEGLVDRWGTLTHERGKTVWFELTSAVGLDPGTAPLAQDPAEAVVAPGAADRDDVDVVLLNVPLLLHAAWQQHAEELLREYLLVALDRDDPTDALEVHAAASSAMSVLHEHLPVPDLGEDPGALMASAVEPVVSRGRLLLPVSRTDVPAFEVLDETLGSALAMADSGELLTRPIQPELRRLRRWLCQEVRRQARGEPPTAWSYDAGAPPPLPPAPQPASWEDDVGDVSGPAVIVADDTDRIVSVGQAVLELLGYQEPDQLVGRRLVTIIPPRYHQAHLAGFTMHLSTGRSPLLGRRVIVPALRRDGTEIPVELVVHSHHFSGDRLGFIAHLRPGAQSIET
jgi:PAS domain S-box-containing protein